VHIATHGHARQYFYLARTSSWSAKAADRSGPEFTDPARGEYHLHLVPLTAEAVAATDLKPDDLFQFLLRHVRTGTDLFTLPDLRTDETARQAPR
jgi:hypothetical protein